MSSGSHIATEQACYSGSGVPLILVSSGSIGNNGALTAVTALPTTYSNGAYVFYPASAIAAGSAAGWYWTVFSSTTAGTIFNNTYTAGQPAPPAAATPFVTTGPGAFTAPTTVQTALSLALPPAAFNGGAFYRLTYALQVTNSANNKTIAATLGGATILNRTVTTVTTEVGQQLGWERGVTNPSTLPVLNGAAQVCTAAAQIATQFSSGTNGLSLLTGVQTVQNGANVTIPMAINLTLANAADNMILEAYQLEVIPN